MELGKLHQETDITSFYLTHNVIPRTTILKGIQKRYTEKHCSYRKTEFQNMIK